ncbi:unnamed protein product [Brassicogethes aeneus]|uniref:DUF4817 domain-containing protein n=1 Tax=Brassicogethes aeneus TaxID=1431903 RepID=A0A9P0FLH6_BRAAE|nr:unnamed protein product [Brassicogethes aeneus]
MFSGRKNRNDFDLWRTGRNLDDAVIIYAQRFPDKIRSRTSFHRTIKQVTTNGSVQPEKRVRRATVTGGNSEINVLAAMAANPHASTRELSRDWGISQSSPLVLSNDGPLRFSLFLGIGKSQKEACLANMEAGTSLQAIGQLGILKTSFQPISLVKKSGLLLDDMAEKNLYFHKINALLSEKFSGRLMSPNGGINWQPRSWDLTPPDLSL